MHYPFHARFDFIACMLSRAKRWFETVLLCRTLTLRSGFEVALPRYSKLSGVICPTCHADQSRAGIYSLVTDGGLLHAQASRAGMFKKARQLKEAGAKPGGGWVSKSPARGQAAWKNSDTLEGLEKGSRVWHKAGANAWVLGTLLAQQGASWSVALDSENGEGTGPVGALSHT